MRGMKGRDERNEKKIRMDQRPSTKLLIIRDGRTWMLQGWDEKNDRMG